MSNGGSIGSIDIHFENSVEDLTRYLPKRQRRGTWAARVAQGPDGVAMATAHEPTVLPPEEIPGLYSKLKDKLDSQAVIEGVNLEEAKETIIVQLFPETGKRGYSKADYAPSGKIRFVFEVKLGNPTSSLYF
jgi:hypothetical protein